MYVCDGRFAARASDDVHVASDDAHVVYATMAFAGIVQLLERLLPNSRCNAYVEVEV